MSSAGQQLVAGRIPGERIATDEDTGDSSTFTTTETEVMSVTAALVSGRTYRVRFIGHWNSSVNGDRIIARLREDNTTGTQRQQSDPVVAGGGTIGFADSMEFEYTAASTANKTFVVTGQRGGGTGNCNLEAASTRPAYLYVDYIRG